MRESFLYRLFVSICMFLIRPIAVNIFWYRIARSLSDSRSGKFGDLFVCAVALYISIGLYIANVGAIDFGRLGPAVLGFLFIAWKIMDNTRRVVRSIQEFPNSIKINHPPTWARV